MARLVSARLKYFLKHEEIEVEFSEGLNVIRGANEAGKSALMEGIGYCLGGSSMLSRTIGDTVNWNAKGKASLKTEVDFVCNDQSYLCKRSVSGAELFRGDQLYVTGQNEVTAEVERLFAIPAGKMALTMFAYDEDIRGVLSAGNTAAAEFIEKIADFAGLDKLITDVAASIPSGPTSALVELQAETEKKLEELPGQIEVNLREEEIAQAATRLAQEETDLATLREAKQVILGQLVELKSKQRDKELAEVETKQIALRVDKLRLNLSEFEPARKQLLEAEKAMEGYKAWALYSDYLRVKQDTQCDYTWDEDSLRLDEEIQERKERITQGVSNIARLQSEVKEKQSHRITKGVCPTCGTELVSPEAIAAKNEEIAKAVASLKQHIAEEEAFQSQFVQELRALEGIKAVHLKRSGFAYGKDYITYEGTLMPFELQWVGDIPEKILPTLAPHEMKKLKDELEQLPNVRDELIALEATLMVKQETVKALGNEISARLPIVEQEFSMALTKEDTLGNNAQVAALVLQSLNRQVAEEKALAERLESERKNLTSQVKDLQGKIEILAENNSFIKALRDARVKVTSLLWEQLMVTVSAYFSQMREETSVVTKAASGFLVDGRAGRPSRSTKDILGLALRMAVTKMFCEGGFMFLDEVSAGCTPERTAAITGCLLSAGFDQVIMITHKDVDDAAGNLILL